MIAKGDKDSWILPSVGEWQGFGMEWGCGDYRGVQQGFQNLRNISGILTFLEERRVLSLDSKVPEVYYLSLLI